MKFFPHKYKNMCSDPYYSRKKQTQLCISVTSWGVDMYIPGAQVLGSLANCWGLCSSVSDPDSNNKMQEALLHQLLASALMQTHKFINLFSYFFDWLF